jgi:hypothetical protein
LLASRAVDLRANITRVALDVLAATRTEEFEFSHIKLVLIDYDTRAGGLLEKNGLIFKQADCRQDLYGDKSRVFRR